MTFLLITQWRQGLKVDILRMEREDTDTAIRVAVGPGMGDGGIINRQDLQHTLFGSRHPVDHLHQVTEVADTEALFAPQGEHRYQGSSAFHVIDGEEGLWQLIHHDISFVQQGQADGAVHTILPQRRHIILLVENDEFEFEDGPLQSRGIDIHHPLVVAVLCHGKRLLDVPVAKGFGITYHGKTLVLTQLRGAHLQTYGVGEGFRRTLHRCMPGDAIREGRAVEVGIIGHVNPVVIDKVVGSLLTHQLQAVGIDKPFMPAFFSVGLHAVKIVQDVANAELAIQFITPVRTIEGTHTVGGHKGRILSVVHRYIQNQFLSEYCLILYVKY